MILSSIILVLAAMAAIYHLRKSPVNKASSNSPAPSVPRRRASDQPSSKALVLTPAVATDSLLVPAQLAALRLIDRDELAAERRQALVADLVRVPRPPLSLQKLISPELLDDANSHEICDLIIGEALIAARVLARVNSPFYGLRSPVVSIGQAVTFLGLNGVRSICLQYLMDESFKASSPERKQAFNIVLAASGFAGELCASLAGRLDLADQGSLVTQVVLSFLGHLATTSLMPSDSMLPTREHGLIERTNAEQAHFGLGAAEIGGLLMEEWNLPASLVAEVREIDRILVTPPDTMESNRSMRLALCYLCARLGERLALSSPHDLTAMDLDNDSSADLFYLRRHLNAPRLARLTEFLHSAELRKSIHQMQLAIRTRD